MAPEHPMSAFQKNQEEIRHKVIGSDTTITGSGFIDTLKIASLISSRALQLTREKNESDVHKFS